MDTTDWVMLALASIYFLFNIKNVYYFFVRSFYHNGIMFTLWIILFITIFITGCIIGVSVPKYNWMPQWAFIWAIVGFLVYRNTIGFKDD